MDSFTVVRMMDPISDGNKVLESLPPLAPSSTPPPPPPSSPPPTAVSPGTPPTKPRKISRRSVSPTKEMHTENGLANEKGGDAKKISDTKASNDLKENYVAKDNDNVKENNDAGDNEDSKETDTLKENCDAKLNKDSKESFNGKKTDEVKENGAVAENGDIEQDGENGSRTPPPSPSHSDGSPVLKKVARVQKEKVKNSSTLAASDDDLHHSKVNGEVTTNGVHNGDTNDHSNDEENFSIEFPGGVAKIVGEIEKFNSADVTENCTKNSTKTAFETRLETVSLDTEVEAPKAPRNLTEGKSDIRLSEIEKSVLREMPVDVDIEAEERGYHGKSNHVRKRRTDLRRADSNGVDQGGFSSGGEDSPRKSGQGVKRTPTMEFKKQCSKIVRIRTKVRLMTHFS